MTTAIHGTELLAEDGQCRYYRSEYGIKAVSHSDEWMGYYRIGEGYGKWELVLTAFCYGRAPGIITAGIRAWEDIERKTKATN